MKKNTKKRLAIASIAIIVIFIFAFLYWPGNSYVRCALLNGLPKIDQYVLFDHNVVKAKEPKLWEYGNDVANRTIPKEFEDAFNLYKTTAFLIIEDGKIEFEQYWDAYEDGKKSNSFSMAKTVVSLLIGCAIDDGYIKSVDEFVSNYVSGCWGKDGDTTTIKDLLTMSAGWDWDESASSLFSPTTKMYYGEDLHKIINQVKLKDKPGVFFEYQSGVTQLLAFILEKATAKSLAEYASEKLWTPLGAEEDAWWSTDEYGVEKAYCCFNSQARDFARLGQLILQKGYWNGIKLVGSTYINDAISPATHLKYLPNGAINSVPCTFYGYQIWILNYKGHQIPYFRGILGQYIFIIPEMNRVVVRLGHKRGKTYNKEQNYPIDIDVWLDAALSMKF